jgi:H+/Cl- antiporter ClcA
MIYFPFSFILSHPYLFPIHSHCAGISFLCLFFLTTLTFGCGVSGASFIPCLLVGAIYGRFFGYLVTMVVTTVEFDPGAFALIGAGTFSSLCLLF